MSVADDRQQAITFETKELLAFYALNGGPDVVRLFAEDDDFLDKRKAIVHRESGDFLDFMQVLRGQRKKKARKRRPKSSLF